MDKEGGYSNRPPMLDGYNYDWWKVRMIAFLKSIDNNKAWRAVIKGWKHPVVRDVGADGKETGTTSLKPEADWDENDDKEASGNSKALNALFNGVDKNVFRLINNCTEAKEAWEILKTTYEGTSKVKSSRLQLLTTKFENLKMGEDETIQEYQMKILEIANASSSLGERIPETKLVRKILRTLPRKFDIKVTAIKESHDIDNMRMDELIGSLQTFELAIGDRVEKKNKIIAFVSNTEDKESQLDMDTEEGLTNTSPSWKIVQQSS